MAWDAGSNYYGQLGISGISGDVGVPTAVSSLAGVSAWASVSAGGYHTCAIATGGGLYCFGECVCVWFRRVWSAMGAAWSATGAITGEGICRDVGDYDYGQLGISGVSDNVRVPTVVSSPAGVSAWASVSAGGYHTCAIAAGGLYCFGESLFTSVVTDLGSGGAHPLPKR